MDDERVRERDRDPWDDVGMPDAVTVSVSLLRPDGELPVLDE